MANEILNAMKDVMESCRSRSVDHRKAQKELILNTIFNAVTELRNYYQNAEPGLDWYDKKVFTTVCIVELKSPLYTGMLEELEDELLPIKVRFDYWTEVSGPNHYFLKVMLEY